MDIVIYHYRGREKFIPMGYASTQFSITGELQVISVSFVEKAAQSLNSLSGKNLTTANNIKHSSTRAHWSSVVFSLDQIPFAVSLDQVNDIVSGDLRFIQNKAITFTVTLHDPSEYLSNADITFNWDFGDQSGALISRELTVTHTYINSGSFKPQVVVQAVIPDKACDPPVDPTTKAPSPPTNHGTTGK